VVIKRGERERKLILAFFKFLFSLLLKMPYLLINIFWEIKEKRWERYNKKSIIKLFSQTFFFISSESVDYDEKRVTEREKWELKRKQERN
jgi:hypothetical protein